MSKAPPKEQVYPELKAVLDYQSEVEVTRDKMYKLEQLIAEREQLLQTILSGMPAVEQVLQERESLQAAIALGEIAGADIKRREAEISNLEKQYAEQTANIERAAEPVQQAINGLRRQLEGLRSKLQLLTDEAPKALRAFLVTEAERVCVDYVNSCLMVKETYQKLLALNQMLRPLGQDLLSAASHDILLPTFNLPQCGGLGDPNIRAGNVIFSVNIWAPPVDASSEAARVRALGVNLE